MTKGEGVIAPRALAAADALPPSACHCEPVRTLVWQSASPQRSLASWLLFGQIRDALRMRPKYYFLSCLTAGSTDCHVASLLAMTCRRKGVCAGARTWGARACRRRGRVRRCKDVGREGVQKAGACAQVQGGVARKVCRTLPRIWGCKVVFHSPCTRSPIMVHPTILPAKPGKTALTNRGRCTRISP